jgi:prevent-host-death family protein
MRTMSTNEAQASLGKLIEAAKFEPVTLTEGGLPSAVVLSFEDYERITGAARLELQAAMQTMRAEAAARGLTEEKLAELLADES